MARFRLADANYGTSQSINLPDFARAADTAEQVSCSLELLFMDAFTDKARVALGPREQSKYL